MEKEIKQRLVLLKTLRFIFIQVIYNQIILYNGL